MRRRILVASAIAGVMLVMFGVIGLLNQSPVTNNIREMLGSETVALAGEVICSDDEFLRAADKAARFVSNSIESGHEYDVTFILRLSEGHNVPIVQNHTSGDGSSRWRRRLQESVLAGLVSDQMVRSTYNSGKRVVGVSTTISYSHDYCIASIVDSDNDGVMDEKHVSYL